MPVDLSRPQSKCDQCRFGLIYSEQLNMNSEKRTLCCELSDNADLGNAVTDEIKRVGIVNFDGRRERSRE